MSELQKLLKQRSPLATPATPATERAKSSNCSKSSRGADSEIHFSLVSLRRRAGDDWPEISADPAQLAGFKAAAETAAAIRRGEVPLHYTATTECTHCGPVPIFPGLPLKVDGCVWCLNRVDGRPMPRAK